MQILEGFRSCLFPVLLSLFVFQTGTGQTVPAKDINADSLCGDFMTKYNVPGLSIAITKSGNLVFAKGYGKANLKKDIDVSTKSLFRIASVSKPITAVAIMKLVEMGKLSLDDKVFGDGAILKNTYGNKPYDEKLLKLTVRILLMHRAGGWGNSSNDPMFQNKSMSLERLISWTVDNIPLKNIPGETYEYSNFGYAILGRVIEKVSGQTYERFVKQKILLPAGIVDMQIGAKKYASRKKNEVAYYGQNGGNPYRVSPNKMDSHGGWIASATDLAKFLVSVDGFSTKPDILSPQSIKEMTTITGSGNYALGWNVNKSDSWYHSGGLTGTISIIVRTQNGYNWAILCNTRSNKEFFGRDLDRLPWQIYKSFSSSEIDLFK